MQQSKSCGKNAGREGTYLQLLQGAMSFPVGFCASGHNIQPDQSMADVIDAVGSCTKHRNQMVDIVLYHR